MLQYSETQNPKAIEDNVCRQIRNSQCKEMDRDLFELLGSLVYAKENIPIPQKEKPFLFQVIEKRVEHCFQFTFIDNRPILFLCAIAETTGSAILYLWYLQWWCANHDIKEVSLELFCERIFPMGFPSKEDLHKIWDSQKVVSEKGAITNLIDYASAGQSLLFFGSVIQNEA
jgi:hypothetical protein